MLLNILLVILVLDCIALTGVILMQRSEGGALGMGGGPSGMFTARGAGDLLTRVTSICTAVFFILSLAITLLAGHSRENASLTQRMKVNPIDLSALAKASSAPPAASSAPAAPPLPNAAPPLPNAAPPLPGSAPLATRPAQAAPPPASSRAAPTTTLRGVAPPTQVTVPPLPAIGGTTPPAAPASPQ
jgi:preprotein translocase subunit SecG